MKYIAATISVMRRAAVLAALTTAALAGPGAAVLLAQQPATDVGGRAPRVRVDTIIVRGNVRQQEDDVRAATGISVGDSIDFRMIQTAIKRLWSTGNFKDVKIFADGAQGTPAAKLVVQVEEQPFLADVQFRGLEHIHGSSITDTLGIKAATYLHPGKVAEAEVRIRKQLGQKGFEVRKLTHHLEPMPEYPGEFRLVFDVDEGSRVALAEVEFEGNKVFSDDELRGAIDTKKEGFLWFRSGQLDDARLTKDLKDNLPVWYGGHGYIDFQVVGDSVVVDEQTGKARLVIHVDEGEQYQLGTFDVHGNHRYPSEDLKRYFDTQKGGLLASFKLGGSKPDSIQVFDKAAFDEATGKIEQLYRNSGYLYAHVEPIIDKDTIPGKKIVNVSWEVQEGNPAYVAHVTITGNTFTHERVVREQVLLLPGDTYSEDLLIQSYRNIQALGFFESPMPMPKIEPNDKGDVEITFEVKEKQTGSINFGTALGGGAGVAGFLGYDQPNLFGQAKSGHLRWEFGQFSNNFEATYTDPAINQSLVSGSVSLFSSRDRFFQFSQGARRRTGASLRFGLPVPSDRSGRTRFFLGYSLARTSYTQFEHNTNSALFGLPSGIQSTITLNLVRNTLDSPLFPTVGTKQEISADFNGGPLGGDARFNKYTVNGSWFVPVGSLGAGKPGTRPIRFTLGLHAEAGALFGNASNFPFERFWLGGVQFGRPLRGYEETSITPLGYVPKSNQDFPLQDRLGNAYMKLTAEYALRFNDNMSLSAFYDAGNIWRKPVEINPTRMIRGAGLGVQLVTPFGPLGLDYAYGFDKDVPSWQLHFRFGPGF